jgi:hypothetical protein
MFIIVSVQQFSNSWLGGFPNILALRRDIHDDRKTDRKGILRTVY